MIYQVDVDDLREIESYLNMAKDKSKIVLRSAINDTANETIKFIYTGTTKRYAYKKSLMREAMNGVKPKRKATTSNLVAIIEVKSSTTDLYDSTVRPKKYVHPVDFKNKPKFYKGKVLRASPLMKLALRPNATGDKYKAFIIKFRSGKITIAQRVPGKRMKSKPHKEFVKKLLAPSVPKMAQVVYEDIHPQVEDILAKHIAQRIEKHLG